MLVCVYACIHGKGGLQHEISVESNFLQEKKSKEVRSISETANYLRTRARARARKMQSISNGQRPLYCMNTGSHIERYTYINASNIVFTWLFLTKLETAFSCSSCFLAMGWYSLVASRNSLTAFFLASLASWNWALPLWYSCRGYVHCHTL